MEDKIFELLTKLYSDMQEGFNEVHRDLKGIHTEINEIHTDINEIHTEINGIHTDINEIHTEINGIHSEIDGIHTEINGIRGDIIRLENKLDTNSKALFDGYHQTYEKVVELDDNIKDLSNKVEKQDFEVRLIKKAAN